MTGQPRQRAQATATEQRKLQRRLDAIVELHAQGPSGWCSACLLEHPCPTRRLATGDAPVTQP